MQPTLANISSFSVTGIAVRTRNSDEFNPATAKLPALWGSFFQNGVATRVLNAQADSPVFGVYSGYESDASGSYTVTAGVAAPASDASEYASIDIEAGKYLVFENKGPMPQAVIDTWGHIWAFFEENTEFNRSFSTDFEEYRGPDEIAVHIGVRG